MLKKIFYFGFLLFGLACHSTKTVVDTKPKKDKPMVLTMILELQASNHGTETKIQLLDKVQAPGHAKIVPDKAANFEFRFVDDQSHALTSVYKKINLTQVYEYVNDDGKLTKKVMDGAPIVVPIRTNYQPKMAKMIVYQLMKENYEPIASFLIHEKTN